MFYTNTCSPVKRRATIPWKGVSSMGRDRPEAPVPTWETYELDLDFVPELEKRAEEINHAANVRFEQFKRSHYRQTGFGEPDIDFPYRLRSGRVIRQWG